MKLENSTRSVRIAFSLFLLGLIVVPNVLLRGHQSLAQNSSTQTTSTQSNSNPAMQQTESTLVREYLDGMQKLRGADLTPEARAQLTQEMAQKRAQLRDLRRQTRLANGILPFGPRTGGGSKKSAPTAADKETRQSVENCAKCKYVWQQVLSDVGSSKYVAAVQAAFQKNCQNAQKATIYYGVCEDMYDDMYAMTDDYMTDQFDVAGICSKAGFCSQ